MIEVKKQGGHRLRVKPRWLLPPLLPPLFPSTSSFSLCNLQSPFSSCLIPSFVIYLFSSFTSLLPHSLSLSPVTIPLLPLPPFSLPYDIFLPQPFLFSCLASLFSPFLPLSHLTFLNFFPFWFCLHYFFFPLTLSFPLPSQFISSFNCFQLPFIYSHQNGLFSFSRPS